MSAEDGRDAAFEEDVREPDAEVLLVSQDAYEGPLDLLVDLVRAKKVDIGAISILEVVDSFFAWMRQAREMRLELAADWLVMMATLAWLKSKLLLPAPKEDTEKARAVIEDLAVRLKRLDAIRSIVDALQQRPRLGHTWHEPGSLDDRSGPGKRLDATLHALLVAYKKDARHTVGKPPPPVRKPFLVMSVEEAIRYLSSLGDGEDWIPLLRNLPPLKPVDAIHARSRIASTYVAALELAKRGRIDVRPSEDGNSISFRPVPGAAA